MKMTYELMRELGTCGDYRSKFRQLFPTSEYPEGIEITVENCVAHAQNFDWYWAVDVLLTSEAASQWRNYVDSELSATNNAESVRIESTHRDDVTAWREKFDEPRSYVTTGTSGASREAWDSISERYNAEIEQRNKTYTEGLARKFGELFQEPTNRSSSLVAKVQAAAERVERAERQALTDAEVRVATATNGIANAQRDLEHHTAELPLAQRALVDAKAQFTAREVQRAERRAQEAADAVAAAKVAAEEARLAKETQDAPVTEASDAGSAR
jgi:hypothetical protein